MKIGIYSVTYRGVWYQGEALDAFSLMRLSPCSNVCKKGGA